MSTPISAAALARELGCHRSTITRYAARGMPLTSRAKALRWIANCTSGHGGGWTGGVRGQGVQARAEELLGGRPATQSKRRSAPPHIDVDAIMGSILDVPDEETGPDPEADLDTYRTGQTDGACFLAHHACRNLRASIPDIIAPWKISDDADDALRWKTALIALVDHLVSSWYESMLSHPQHGRGPLPEINWAPYGDRAEEAARHYREWREYFADDEEDEEVPAIPRRAKPGRISKPAAKRKGARK